MGAEVQVSSEQEGQKVEEGQEVEECQKVEPQQEVKSQQAHVIFVLAKIRNITSSRSTSLYYHVFKLSKLELYFTSTTSCRRRRRSRG